tara:strand:+ start:1343 stop:2458 length:1116 start_codon:yes stop_codon:yes gene_type:complete
MQSTNTASWAATGGKRAPNFSYLRHQLGGWDLDSTNYFLRQKFPLQLQFVASDTTNPLLNINHDYNGVGLLLDTDGTTADSFQWIADTTTGVVGDWDWASLTTGTGIDIDLTAMTTGVGIDVTNVAAITTGAVFRSIVASSDTGAWKIFHGKVDHVDATGAIPFVGENDSTGPCFQALSNAAGAVGAVMEFNQKSASAADNDVHGRILFMADDEETTPTNTQFCKVESVTIDATAASYGGQLNFYTSASAAANESMRILGDGSLSIDLSSGAGTALVFDDHDDPMVMEMMTTDPPAFYQWLTDEGIASPKATGEGEHMVQLQPYLRLMTGGIYQNRWRMDDQHAAVTERLDSMAVAIAELTAASSQARLNA